MTNGNGSSKDIQPINPDRGVKLSVETRDALDTWIGRQILTGYRLKDIPHLYEQEFNKSLSYSRVKKTSIKLREEWKAQKLDDTNMHIAMELERLDEMEYIAWENYRSCGGTIEETEHKELIAGDGSMREALITVKTKDDPRLAMQWFEKILKIQQDRRKVLRLETTVNIQNVMAVKGYAFFNPTSDWPDPPNLPEPNVIDAEFEEGRE